MFTIHHGREVLGRKLLYLRSGYRARNHFIFIMINPIVMIRMPAPWSADISSLKKKYPMAVIIIIDSAIQSTLAMAMPS